MENSHNLKEILLNCSIRFVINNKAFLSFDENYIFVLEEAYWHALDFYNLTKCDFKQFVKMILKYNGYLDELLDDKAIDMINKIFDQTNDSRICCKNIKVPVNSLFSDYSREIDMFKKYKQRILVYGTVILSGDMKKVLVIKQAPTANLALPKGKKNINESGKMCAIRETYEEIGYDVTDKITDLSIKVFDKMTFYVVLNVPENIKFKTNVRNEIEQIFWVEISKVPDNEKFRIVSCVLKSLKGFLKVSQETMFKFKGLNEIFDGKEKIDIDLKESDKRNQRLFRKLSNFTPKEDPHESRTIDDLNNSE